MPDSAKEPHPPAPHWLVRIGPLIREGDGLLTPEVWKQSHLIDEFTVFFSDWKLKVEPRLGRVWFNSRQVFGGHAQDVQWRLIWFRRMSKGFGAALLGADPNTAAFDCLWYGVGLQATIANRNVKQGWRILPDGRVVVGLE